MFVDSSTCRQFSASHAQPSVTSFCLIPDARRLQSSLIAMFVGLKYSPKFYNVYDHLQKPTTSSESLSNRCCTAPQDSVITGDFNCPHTMYDYLARLLPRGKKKTTTRRHVSPRPLIFPQPHLHRQHCGTLYETWSCILSGHLHTHTVTLP